MLSQFEPNRVLTGCRSSSSIALMVDLASSLPVPSTAPPTALWQSRQTLRLYGQNLAMRPCQIPQDLLTHASTDFVRFRVRIF